MSILLLTIMAVLCQGCANQSPAPIEYYSEHDVAVNRTASRAARGMTMREKSDFAKDLEQMVFTNSSSSRIGDTEKLARNQQNAKESNKEQPIKPSSKKDNTKDLEQLDKMLAQELINKKNTSVAKSKNDHLQDSIKSEHSHVHTTAKKIIYHEVSPGETLDSLAMKYHISAQDIAHINDIDTLASGNAIQPGQLLKLYISDELLQSNNTRQVYHHSDLDNNEAPEHKPTTVDHHHQQEKEVAAIDQAVVESETDVSGGQNLFVRPVANGKILVGFQQIDERGKKNNGINIQAPKGSNVLAICDGKIVYIGNDSTFGNMLVLEGPNEVCVAYAHLEKIDVSKDQIVHKGEAIGKVGATGIVTSPQLHLAIRNAKNNRAINPLEYFSY